ncbi:DNA-binding response regulator [Paenibacillus baekrokdamisoli]|uniref:DNA-binding response regulator n=1 Tax=Paenibacillus baekrokdamisoli TaxID=1712516 RepID=A0A3G9JDQ3_9BACL|nr:response regulator [Paenibacillus baekrokdamisoli]MBB3067852.1 two-component SAPR family response regulator [Paenibacillus baekrokdamisoli]BBH23103.1 DNA-binding response regulator [Paenibacillus baekrokdamisoli]
MLRVMIVEDEKPILDLMEILVGRHPLLELAGTFTDPLEALVKFRELKPDAVFLDVEMPKMGGIELAGRLSSQDEELQVVFTTAYPGYAVEAFRVNAVDYLLKPVMPDSLERVVSRLMKNHMLRSSLRPPAVGDPPPVRCLGTYETRGKGGKLVSWQTRKTEELFAYLLVYPNRLAGKWQLADLLWPELDEDRALHNLHNTVYRLKKALKEAGIAVDLTHTNEGYHFPGASELSDLEWLRDFLSRTPAIDDRNVAEGEKLFRYCRGVLFGGKDYIWSSGLAAEVSAQQASLARMLAAYYRGAGDDQAAKETLLTYLGFAPLDEEITAELLRLYAELGEFGSFQNHYEQYAKRISSELGVGPAEDIRALAERTLGSIL